MDNITRQRTLSNATTITISPQRPVSTTTVNDSTQGDPDQPALVVQEQQPTLVVPEQVSNNSLLIQYTNNFYFPDGTNQRIHDIPAKEKTILVGALENGNNAYLVQLPGLKTILGTSQYLMDESTDQFHAIYGNSYQTMSTHPRLFEPWVGSQLLDELAAMRHTFGYDKGSAEPAAPAQPLQPSLSSEASTSHNKDAVHDLTYEKAPPRIVPFQKPSFNLDRPVRCLTLDERIEVHHNYVSAISDLEHKKDLINRLKRSEPHNIPAYEAEMGCQMALHNNVLDRICTIIKQDDFFRRLEDLPVINEPQPYDDIQLFPEFLTPQPSLNKFWVKLIS